MSNKALEGIIVPMITPFAADGELDLAKAKREVERLVKAGVDGISPGGSTGEGAALSDDELVALIKLICEVAPDILVVAGVIRNSTRAAVQAAKAAKAAGADALMVTPVSYNVLVPDDEGNYNFYHSISTAVGLPIIIYNVVPQNTISAALFSRLLEIEHVVGIKQSVGATMAFYEMVMVNGPRGKVYSATDEMIYTTFQLGAAGAISAILTVFPEICVQMWQDAKAGNHEHGLELQRRMYFVWRAIGGNQFPIRIKYALKLMGRDPGEPRSPICHIPDTEKSAIESALRQAGFIK